MKLNNIKSKLIVIIIAIALVIMGLFVVGCDNTSNSVKANDNMFITVSENLYYAVVYDRDTKIMYTISKGHDNRGNFTVLVTADGTPKLYEGE